MIIEVSLWSKDYFTLDTHPQHTSLWFNECLSHLCDCTCSNVMCMLKYLLIKSKKIFECFICFWKWFYTFMFLVSVQNAFLCFFFKNWFRGCFARSSRLRASREKCLRELNFFVISHRNSRYCLMSISWLIASHESFCASVAILVTLSLLSNPRKTRVFSFYVANVTVFQNFLISLAKPLSNHFQPKSLFHSNPIIFKQNFCSILSRYVPFTLFSCFIFGLCSFYA